MENSVGRRKFLERSTIAGLGLLAAGCSRLPLSTGRNPEKRPNIVFFMTDDQPSNAMGCAGYPGLTTPNTDRIAKEGVYFENAFVTTSLCSPSRASSLTGLHAHAHGVVENEVHDELDPNTPTFLQILQRAGYETAFIGKWHQDSAVDSSPRKGIDYWVGVPGQGVYIDPELNVNGTLSKHQGYMTDILTDYAVKWLEREHEKPFCLCVWHKAAHQPFTPAERHKDALPDLQLPEPRNFRDDYSGKPNWLKRAVTYRPQKDKYLANLDKPLPEEFKAGRWDARQEDRVNYFRTLLAVDDGIGKIFDALDKQGVLDDTAMIYTSDNGFFLGDHRFGDKRMMYEESIRIPMLMRYPKRFRPNTKVAGMALNIDLAPTIIDLAGEPVPDSMQGISLVPLMKGQRAKRESFLYTYFREDWYAGLPLMHGVRTDRWKYITYPDIEDIDELYDLKNDPAELRNLAGLPEFKGQKEKMVRELKRLLVETGYPTEKHPGAPPVVKGQ